MPFLVLLAIFLGIVFLTRAAQRGGRNALLTRGVLARGLVLSAGRQSTEASIGNQRFEMRTLVLDVEVPGKPPYEVSLTTLIPRICEALPGATLDLRVDPAKPSNLAIVGPLGASQWIGAAANVPGQTWAAGQAGARRGCGTIVLALIGASLALGAVLSFGASGETPRPTPAPTPAVTPRTTPTATATATAAPAARVHPQCEAAFRCCETLGHSHATCQAYLSETDTSCTKGLAQEKAAAVKAGKRCP
jgi:hypothetical protein